MNQRTILAAGLALVAGLSGCKGELPAAVVVYARGADSESLDPQGIDDGESAKVVQNVFEGLVSFAPGSTAVEPAIAESWETSGDGLTWTFRIRGGITFHDGTPCDADAVVFTFQRHIDEAHPQAPTKNPYQGFFSEHIESVEATDASTVVFTLKHSYAPFLQNLAMFSAFIVSPTAVKAVGADAFGKAPVGCGPFVFDNWDHAQKKITLRRFDGYWRGAPSLDRVVFLTIPDNNARLQALRSGGCNWMDGLNLEDLDGCRSDPKLKVWSATTMNVGYLALNTQRKPFDDVRVRRAVKLAIDRKALVEALYLGAGVPAVHPVPPGILGAPENAVVEAPDLDASRALLAEAGFPDGFESELFAMPNPRPYFPNPQTTAEVIKADLEKVGIRVRINTVGDWTQYLEAVQNAKHPMCMLGWTTDNGDPDNFLYTFFSERSARVGGGSMNMAFWVDPRMQEFLKQGQTLVDPVERERVYRKALDLVQEEVPMIPIAHSERPWVSTPGFEGFVVQPTGDVRLWSVKPASGQ